MTPEQMQKVVDDAPEWASGYCERLSVYTASEGQNAKHLNITSLDDMRAEIAKQDTLDLEPADIPHGCIVLEK